jgi:integrase
MLSNLRSRVFFDSKYSSYRARMWGGGYDTTTKIPDAYWKSLGHEPPTQPSKKMEQLAVRWAVLETQRREALGSARAAGRVMTIAEMFEFYEKKNPNLVTSSSMARSEQMSKQLVAFFGARSPETIDMAAALEYRNKRIEDGVRFRSIWNELSFLKQLLTYGYENMSETGMGRLMLLRLPKLPKQESSGIALTKDEFFRILRVGHLERDGGRIVRIVTFGVITMLRRSVLLGLRWEWIDLEQRWLNVPASYMKGKQGMKRPLSVPLCDWAIELLGEPRKGGYVWPNVVTQRPLDNVFYSLERLSVAAQTREFSLHDLRRTGTSFLANAGVDRIIRKILLGHATDNEVTDLYTFIDKEKLRETVTFFDGLKREFLGKTWKVLKMQSGSNE